eukprot:SAG31_NODE_6981_length_1827_cov_3.899884_2_plen_109_part_00
MVTATHELQQLQQLPYAQETAAGPVQKHRAVTPTDSRYGRHNERRARTVKRTSAPDTLTTTVSGGGVSGGHHPHRRAADPMAIETLENRDCSTASCSCSSSAAPPART